MKHHLLNALLIIMVITLVLIPVIGIDIGSSPGKDQNTSARAEAAQIPNESELEIELSDNLGMLGTLDERDWAIFQRLAELEPAQWERLCWLLEQYDNARRLDAPAMDGILTDYDIELVSYVIPDYPAPDIPAETVVEKIWNVIQQLGTWFDKLTGTTFVTDTIDSALDMVAKLVTKYQYFTESDCEKLRTDLLEFVFGNEDITPPLKGLDDILWDLVELGNWAYGVDYGVELPDLAIIEDTIKGELKIPCFLLFPVSLALEMTPGWQELPPTIYKYIPHAGTWPSMCDLLLAEPAVGNLTLTVKFVLDGAVALLETIEVITPSDLTIDIAGEGTTLPIGHPLKIAVGLITKAVNVAAVLADALYTKIDTCGTDKFQGDVTASLADIEADLADVVEHRDVDLQVIEIKAKQKFLVSASEAGIPLEGVVFTSVLASKNNPVSFEDITAYTESNMVRLGVYLVEIDLPSSVRDASIFAFEASHTNGSVEHLGFIVFDASG